MTATTATPAALDNVFETYDLHEESVCVLMVASEGMPAAMLQADARALFITCFLTLIERYGDPDYPHPEDAAALENFGLQGRLAAVWDLDDYYVSISVLERAEACQVELRSVPGSEIDG